MKRPTSITAELNQASIVFQAYVTQLEKENLKLQKEIGKVQAKYVTEQNKTAAAKKGPPKVNIVMNLGDTHETHK